LTRGGSHLANRLKSFNREFFKFCLLISLELGVDDSAFPAPPRKLGSSQQVNFNKVYINKSVWVFLLVIFFRPKKGGGEGFLGNFLGENLGNFSKFWGKKSPKS